MTTFCFGVYIVNKSMEMVIGRGVTSVGVTTEYIFLLEMK
jgi:hypothetical protein